MAGGLWVRALRPCHRIPVPTYLVKSDGRPSLFTTYHHNSPLPEYYTRAVIRQRAFEGRNGQADGNQDAFWRRVRGISGAGFSASLAPGSRPAWARSECAPDEPGRIVVPAIRSLDEVDKLKVVNPETDGRIPALIEGIRIMVKQVGSEIAIRLAPLERKCQTAALPNESA